MSIKMVYSFGDGKAEGKSEMKHLLGGKGANLAEMSNLGIRVPAGFTITTEVCKRYYANDHKYPQELEAQVKEAISEVENSMGAKFNDSTNPLLLSVRSGARASMPGMMDTVLNLGLNDVSVQGIIKQSNNERYAWDSYRRFVQMYGDVVMDLKPESKEAEDPFEVIIDEMKAVRGVKLDADLIAADVKELVTLFKMLIKEKKGADFPTDPWEQLWGSIGAVFNSWMNQRAITYRKLNGIPADWGTAINVQAMVFGNMGDDCATGVAFTRDPATGENVFFGEYLINAQGEDVVAGHITAPPISEMKKWNIDLYNDLIKIGEGLEKKNKDMQEIEFTIEDGELFILQTRNGLRSSYAEIRIALDLLDEGIIEELGG